MPISVGAPSGGLNFASVTYVGDGAVSKLIAVGFRARFCLISDATAGADRVIFFSGDGKAGAEIVITSLNLITGAHSPYATAAAIDVGAINADLVTGGLANGSGHNFTLLAFG